MSIDFLTFLIVLIITAMAYFFFSPKLDRIGKLAVAIFVFTFFVYSGVGIANEGVSAFYVASYTLFLLTFLGVFILIYQGAGKHRTFRIKQISLTPQKIESKINNGVVLINVMTFVFFAAMFFNAIYPANNLASFLQGIFTSRLSGLNLRQNAHDTNTLSNIADMLVTISMPFYFIKLYSFCKNKRFVLGLASITAWVILQYAKYNYLGRSDMVEYLFFAFCYVIIYRYDDIVFKSRYLTVLGIAACLLLPFMVNYTSTRLGSTGDTISIIEALKIMVNEECYYPIYYDTCVKNVGTISPFTFLLWIVFLPIPSIIWPSKPTIHINFVFSSLLRGYGSTFDAGYYVSLPSILGESLLIFGPIFCWIEALIISLIIGLFLRFARKSKQLIFVSIYSIILLATLSRGGSGGLLGSLINGNIFLLIWLATGRCKIR